MSYFYINTTNKHTYKYLKDGGVWVVKWYVWKFSYVNNI